MGNAPLLRLVPGRKDQALGAHHLRAKYLVWRRYLLLPRAALRLDGFGTLQSLLRSECRYQCQVCPRRTVRMRFLSVGAPESHGYAPLGPMRQVIRKSAV